AALVSGVVEGAGVHELALVAPGLDARRDASFANQQAIVHHAVPGRWYSGDHRRVVRPGHRRIDRPHPFRDGTGRGEAPQRWHRQIRVVEGPPGESIEADDHDVIRRLRTA